MDVLRKELNTIYERQNLCDENLDYSLLTQTKDNVEIASKIGGSCMVVTDAAADNCYIYGGKTACIIGICDLETYYSEMNSSDEDIIYVRIHPEDLVDKRMLEYEFFKFVDSLPSEEKLNFKATCRLRIKDKNGKYIYLDNSTRIAQLSENGKIWLILCTYDLSSLQERMPGITPRIVNHSTGDVKAVDLSERRIHILTEREKEILNLIREGKPSKQISALLGISIHTVNRHRQNILEKLSVGNSVEAIMAATLMKLI